MLYSASRLFVACSSGRPFVVAKNKTKRDEQEFTTIERRLMALAEEDGRNKEEIEEEENKAKAVIAAKTGNLSVRHIGHFVRRFPRSKADLAALHRLLGI